MGQTCTTSRLTLNLIGHPLCGRVTQAWFVVGSTERGHHYPDAQLWGLKSRALQAGVCTLTRPPMSHFFPGASVLFIPLSSPLKK